MHCKQIKIILKLCLFKITAIHLNTLVINFGAAIQTGGGAQEFLQDCMCAQRKLRSAYASAQSDLSLQRSFRGLAMT